MNGRELARHILKYYEPRELEDAFTEALDRMNGPHIDDLFAAFLQLTAKLRAAGDELVCLTVFRDGSGRVSREYPYKNYVTWDKSPVTGDFTQAIAAIQEVLK